MARERSTWTVVEKRAKVAKQKLKAFEDNFLTLKEEWINEGINSCANAVVQELAKEFQLGYDFALDKWNLLADHELRVPVQNLRRRLWRMKWRPNNTLMLKGPKTAKWPVIPFPRSLRLKTKSTLKPTSIKRSPFS